MSLKFNRLIEEAFDKKPAQYETIFAIPDNGRNPGRCEQGFDNVIIYDATQETADEAVARLRDRR